MDATNGCELHICHLYPREMNIYGDHGNLLVLRHRAETRGINVRVSDYHPGQAFPCDVDLLLGGGGQDSGQLAVQSDLPRVAAPLRELVEAGAAALMVCGMYQLFGNYFRTATGETIEGLGILNMHTVAGQGRMIGNITTQSTEFGEVIGYENHSGRTWLNAAQDDSESGHGDGSRNTEGRFFCVPGSNLVGDECLLPGTQKNRPSVSLQKNRPSVSLQKNRPSVSRENRTDEPSPCPLWLNAPEDARTVPFARTRKGMGNNGHDQTEGARRNNLIGTYLHGPLLPKNPRIADFLIAAALKHRYLEEVALSVLDDSLAEQARLHAIARPR